MLATEDAVRAVLEGHEPGRGGYGSEFEFEQTDEGVVVTLLAEWHPRHFQPTVLVREVNDDTLVYSDDQDNDDQWEAATSELTAEELADDLADRCP